MVCARTGEAAPETEADVEHHTVESTQFPHSVGDELLAVLFFARVRHDHIRTAALRFDRPVAVAAYDALLRGVLAC